MGYGGREEWELVSGCGWRANATLWTDAVDMMKVLVEYNGYAMRSAIKGLTLPLLNSTLFTIE